MLVDTSVWINHFRHANADLEQLLADGRVVTHPFVVGELACGSLARRREILRLIDALPAVPLASHDEVVAFVEREHLHGTGVGWVDVHLLASARLARQPLWSADRRLHAAAARLHLTL